MPESVSLLMVQFLDWVSFRPRTYADAMDAWRTSCPRLSVWEDALVDGLVEIEGGPSRQSEVRLTPQGRAILQGAGNRQAVSTAAAESGDP